MAGFFGFRRTIYPKRQIRNPMLTSTMPRNDAQSQLGTDSRRTVSYTHLDVYKRQELYRARLRIAELLESAGNPGER